MAVIPLSEIPNAPTATFTPVADPKYSGDVVGSQAISDIKQGFSSAMENPEAMGAVGRAEIGLGSSIQQLGSGLAENVMYADAEKRRQALQQAELTAFPKFVHNQAAVQNNYLQQASQAPATQRPTLWLNAAGKDGENFFNDPNGQYTLTPIERQVVAHHAMAAWGEGLATASHQAYASDIENRSTDLQMGFLNALKTGDLEGAQKMNATGVANGWFSKATDLQNQKAIQTQGEVLGWRKGLQGELNNYIVGGATDPQGNVFKTLSDAADRGEGIGNLDAKNVADLVKYGNAIKDQSLWNVATKYQNLIQSGQLKSTTQLADDKQFQKLPDEYRNAVYGYLAQPFQNTPQGEINRKAGQAIVDNFPPTDGSDIQKAYTKAQIQIMSSVPTPFADDQLKALDKKKQEMASNKGELKEDTKLQQYGSQILEKYMTDQVFGKYDAKKISDGKASTDDLNAYTKALSIREGIMDKLRQAAPKTQQDVEKFINDQTRLLRAGQPNGPRQLFNPSSWLHGTTPPPAPQIKSSNPVIPIKGVGTTYGYSGDKYTDTNSKNGIGDHDNQLQEGSSVGFSPDIKKQIAANGIKKGDPVILHLDDGSQVMAKNDDTTDKKYTGRVDFYNKQGPEKNHYQDRKIVGVQKV